MKKKSKLTIKHYYNEEVKELGKSPKGFPIQVRVRYKRVMTIFSSRFGLKYANSGVHNEQLIRDYQDIAKKIINTEKIYIEKVRDYFEDILGLTFKPPVLVNNSVESIFLKSIIEYFDSCFINYDIERVLYSNGLGVGVDILHQVGATKFLYFLHKVNNQIFEDIIKIRDYKFFFDTYLTLLDKEDHNEMELITFRLIDVEESSNLSTFKKFFDKNFDNEIINELRFDKNYDNEIINELRFDKNHDNSLN